jgi:hypothetical protein
MADGRTDTALLSAIGGRDMKAMRELYSRHAAIDPALGFTVPRAVRCGAIHRRSDRDADHIRDPDAAGRGLMS